VATLTHVLDARAILAHLYGEEGAQEVEALYGLDAAGEARVGVHALNLCGVYHDVLRAAGGEQAEAVLRDLQGLGLHVERSLPDALLRRAGRLKIAFRLSLADAVALARASLNRAALVNCDHPELDPVEAAGEARLHWIR